MEFVDKVDVRRNDGCNGNRTAKVGYNNTSLHQPGQTSAGKIAYRSRSKGMLDFIPRSTNRIFDGVMLNHNTELFEGRRLSTPV
jgi:hypothetical protein